MAGDDLDAAGFTGHFKKTRHGEKRALDSPEKAAKNSRRNGNQPSVRVGAFKKRKH